MYNKAIMVYNTSFCITFLGVSVCIALLLVYHCSFYILGLDVYKVETNGVDMSDSTLTPVRKW